MSAAITGKSKIKEEVQINHEDQKMINAFANKNAKCNELKMTTMNKKKDLQLLEDAEDELLMIESATIPVHIGEVFLHLTMAETERHIESSKEKMIKEVEGYEHQIRRYEAELKDLKVKLYAKFGTNINLEDDEEN